MNTYHITVGTYGTRLHGGNAPTVAKPKNNIGDEFQEFDPFLYSWRRELMVSEPTLLTDEQRLFIEQEAVTICERGQWVLHIIGCQVNHFHLLISAVSEPKAVRRWFKHWLTQSLNQRFGTKHWFAECGSTIWVNDERYFNSVKQYIAKQRFSLRASE